MGSSSYSFRNRPAQSSSHATFPSHSLHQARIDCASRIRKLKQQLRDERRQLNLLIHNSGQLPTRPTVLDDMAAQGSHWSFEEKRRFEVALSMYGPFEWDAIIAYVRTRTEKQVKAYSARYRRRQKLTPHCCESRATSSSTSQLGLISNSSITSPLLVRLQASRSAFDYSQLSQAATMRETLASKPAQFEEVAQTDISYIQRDISPVSECMSDLKHIVQRKTEPTRNAADGEQRTNLFGCATNDNMLALGFNLQSETVVADLNAKSCTFYDDGSLSPLLLNLETEQ